jgi:iron complex transport system ATP-binding protein
MAVTAQSSEVAAGLAPTILPLQARGLAVGRGGRAVLAGVELIVAAGERVAVVGANGSGKTTLLRALAGLDRPLGGEVRWGGAGLPRGAERVKRVGVLLQGESATAFTVREQIVLGLGLDGAPVASAAASVDAALGRMDLHQVAERPTVLLSGGEWQRTLLARALVASPGLLLLDEPTNHLDPARRAELLAILDRLGGAIAVVLATHDLECASRCDRVLMLGRGRVAAIGVPHDVLTPPILADALGVRVRRVEDPEGGAPLLRVVGPS